MKKLFIKVIIFIFIITNFAYSDTSKSTFIKDVNIMFLREDYAGVVKDVESGISSHRLNTNEKKELFYIEGLACLKLGKFQQAREKLRYCFIKLNKIKKSSSSQYNFKINELEIGIRSQLLDLLILYSEISSQFYEISNKIYWREISHTALMKAKKLLYHFNQNQNIEGIKQANIFHQLLFSTR